MNRNMSLRLGFGLVSLASLLVICRSAKTQAACATMPNDKGSVMTTVSVPSTQSYTIWSRNKSPTTSSNGYYLQIDTNCGIAVGDAAIPVNTWTWVNYQGGSTSNIMTVNLSAGTHTFRFYGLDASLIVDRVLLTAGSGCTPTGIGDNCVNVTTIPTPVIVSPSSPNPTNPVNGTIQVGTTQPGSKTRILVDGREIAEGEGLIGLDTSKLSDGYHDITISTTNADGTKQISTKQILVQNHAPFWKQKYNQLYKLLRFNKVLTNLVVFVLTAILLGAFLTGVYFLWSKRIWERFTFTKNTKPYSPPIDLTSTSDVGGRVGMVVGSMGSEPLRYRLAARLRAIINIIVFSLIGGATVLYGVAGASSFIVEPENGTGTGISVVRDSSAAGGAYIQFGSGVITPPSTCPTGQTGRPPNCVVPPAQFTSQCLARSGTKAVISGPQKHMYRDDVVKANNIYNATGATWNGLDVNNKPIPWVIIFQGTGPACWYGGSWNGAWNDTDPTVTWENPYHHSAAFTVRVPSFLVEGYRANNNGDGINIETAGTNFHLRAIYLSNMHDDCIQNDSLNSGVVEDSLFDGCYVGISEDDFTKTRNGSANTMTFQNNLLYMKPMPTVFRGTVPGISFLFKGWSQTPSSKMVLKNNIFYITKAPGFEVNGFGVPKNMVFTECSNNTVVWTGPGVKPPGNWPDSCFTFTKDVSVWNNSVASWKTKHPTIK